MAQATTATWPPAPADPNVPRALSGSIILAGLVVATAFALRLTGPADGFALGTALLPLLFAGAGLFSATLLRRRSVTGASLAAVAAAGIAAVEVVGLVKGRQADAALGDWPLLAASAEGGLLLAALTAATYAMHSRGSSASAWTRIWQLLCAAGLVAVVAAGAWAAMEAFGSVGRAAIAAADVDIWPVRASGRIAIAYLTLAALGGAMWDLAPVARRAWARSNGPRQFPRALGDELLPTSTAMRRRGEEDERARLAADLHARVLPDLRRAAAAAEAEGGVAGQPITAGLRQAIEDVEQLMHSRQSIVLEEYGLVAALEWLAERTQARTRLDVVVELEGATVDDPAAIPRHIGRAAFRVALLAIDNVARHANASRALLRLTVDPNTVDLVIGDDGHGFDGDSAPRNGRGLIDMRTTANAVGATVLIAADTLGTRVAFRWSGPANPATRERNSTGGPRSAPG